MSHAPNTVPLRDQSLFMAGSGTAEKYFFGKHLLIQPLKSQKEFTQPQISIKK
jgi:hypothetical protein